MHGGEPFGQDARQVLGDAASGDVGHAVDQVGSVQLLDGVQVAAVGLHQGCAGFLLEGIDVLLGAVSGGFEEELAGEGVSIGMEAGGGQADEDVSGFDFCAGDELVAVDGADDEAGEVVLTLGVEAGHLGGFAADEGAAVCPAGFCETGDDFFGHFAVEGSGGQVIEEEEWGRALHGDVVDAMVDEVGADGVVDSQFEGDFELGADTVCTGDEDRLLVLEGVELEEAAKATDFAQHVAVEGALGEVLDALLGAVAAGNVDSGIGVGDWLFLSFGLLLRFGQGKFST